MAGMPRERTLAGGRKLLSGDDLFAMPDLGSCELVRGTIVHAHPSGFRHGKLAGSFFRALDSFVAPRKLGETVVGEVGVYTEWGPDTVRGADVAYISNERLALVKDRRKFLEVAPELVVEVVSAKQPWKRVRRKIEEYFACGVKLVWVADSRKRTVHVHSSPEDCRVLRAGDDLTGGDILPGLRVAVAKLFED
jgi:Uma2 family endonuclease